MQLKTQRIDSYDKSLPKIISVLLRIHNAYTYTALEFMQSCSLSLLNIIYDINVHIADLQQHLQNLMQYPVSYHGSGVGNHGSGVGNHGSGGMELLRTLEKLHDDMSSSTQHFEAVVHSKL